MTWPSPVPAGGVEFFQGTLEATDESDGVRIFDTTHSDGEQAPRTPLSCDDEREVAVIFDEMGTHAIEAGFPVTSEAEFEAVLALTVESVERVIEAGVGCERVGA